VENPQGLAMKHEESLIVVLSFGEDRAPLPKACSPWPKKVIPLADHQRLDLYTAAIG
jgi:hypothetical protein